MFSFITPITEPIDFDQLKDESRVQERLRTDTKITKLLTSLYANKIPIEIWRPSRENSAFNFFKNGQAIWLLGWADTRDQVERILHDSGFKINLGFSTLSLWPSPSAEEVQCQMPNNGHFFDARALKKCVNGHTFDARSHNISKCVICGEILV